MKALFQKRIFITGAASGIGKALAELVSRENPILYLADINESEIKSFSKTLMDKGVRIKYFVYDVGDKEAVDYTIKEVLDDGGLDILINNAGIGYSNEIGDTSVEVWKRLIDTNLLGPIYHVYAVLNFMKEQNGGHIVNISSGQAFFKLPGWGVYASIKAALGIFSEVLYYEVKKFNIRVTTVYPFMVNTPFYKDIKGETFGARLSMRLIPYYSMKPESVAKIIIKAIKKEKKIEMVHPFNRIGFYSQFIPFVHDAISAASAFLLTKRR